MNDEVLSAVKEYAISINSGGKGIADISKIIETTSQLPLASFDHWERLIRSEFFLALHASTKAKWKFWSKPRESSPWMDLINWDGHKREKALRSLPDTAPNPFFFSLTVRRLNDWVPQVRKAARENLLRIAKATNPELVVNTLLVALSNWNSWGRIEEADRTILLNIISMDEIAETLISKLISSTSGPMPSLLSQLGRTSILDGKLEEIAERAIQPAVRAKAYRCLFEGRIVWMEGRKWQWTDIRYCESKLEPVFSERQLSVTMPLLELLRNSSADHSSRVRKVSAAFLIRNLEDIGDQAKGFAELFASDKSDPVSERGRFALKKLRESENMNAS